METAARRRLLTKYLGPQWGATAALGGLMLVATACQLLNPRVLGSFIDAVQAAAPLNSLLSGAAAFLTIAAVGQAASLGVKYLSATIGWRASNALRRDLTEHVLALDLGFHKAHTPGDLVERIDGDVSMLAEFFSELAAGVASNGLLAAGTLVALSLVDWRVGLVGIVYAGLVLLVIRTTREPATAAWHDVRESETALFGQVSEQLYGMEDLRSSGAGGYVMHGLNRMMDRISRRWLRAKVVQRRQSALGYVAYILAQVGALSLSIWLLGRSEATLGSLFAALNYIGLLREPIYRIQRQAGSLQRASAGIRRISALLGRPSQVKQGGGSVLPSGPPSVSFRRVAFQYKDAQAGAGAERPTAVNAGETAPSLIWRLRDLSFELAPGRVMGLLGRTGSGKTTIARLLFRLYDPDRGAIAVHGIDIRDLPLADLRRRIGLVTQHVQVFRATVRDNLTMFDRGIRDTRLHEALDLLGLSPWLTSLPNGLDTRLRTGGEGLSAGEAQLLDLTRVFLRDPDLVILDEASARLDPVTERLLDGAIDRLLENRTAFIIAHRLSTVARADDILILDHGRVVEFGPRHLLTGDPASRFSHLMRTGLQEVLA